MRCANCDNENPDGAKFCMECGAALSRQCANCGAPNPPGAKFCIECGEAIVQGAARATIREAAPSARARGPEAFRIAASAADSAMPSGEERKTVTALFADIKGSTELMEDLDPEEARALVDPALQLMINAARRFDGYIVQSTGDGIFALFGAPVAYEEHPLRALYAALRMQGEIRAYAARLRAEGRPPIEIRVGVNTGEVVVRSIRTGEQSREYTPIGHSTNLASRLQTLAPTGAIVISENTARLAAGYFDLKSMGPVRVRGVSEPVGVYEVAGLGPLRTRLQASAMRGLTKFVGRHDELVRIRRAFAQAGEGHGKLVAAVGDAGLGKSRLFHEFTAAAGSGCLVLQTFALSHGQTSSWMPVIELLKAYFAIGRNDGDRSQREKVTGKLLALDRSLDEALPYVFSLLGVLEDADALARMDPVIRRQRTIDALTQILLRESRNQPLVLVFEDLHWTDESSQQLLDTLAAEVGRSPLLMLVNYRPEYSHRWEGNSDYIELRLTPLAAESADEMLAALLGVTGPDELAELRRLILSRTSGNPLFMEEIVRALFEQKILARNGKVILVRPLEEVRLPPTVEGILAARIDRLPVDEKQLLQTLAVLGREFTLGLVSEMIPAAASNGDSSSGAEAAERMLLRLQASDFIYEEPAWPDTHYAFKHALTQEVAYNSILSERRRSLHERAAHAFEKVFAGRLDDYLTDLAYHHER
ncbi:MAG TPA: adenylate/guanylate cyclase domain-containing protein, partial [Candidatus Binataceae bacterium]|nr:adenylate/guanylate cyclase domain-containing protein [Candidatus Binataceae bacterium]